MQQSQSASAVAIRGQYLSFHFDGRAQGQRQMRLGIQRACGEGLHGEFFGLFRVGIGFVELARDQIAAREPRERFQILRRYAALRPIALEHRFGQREIAARHRGLDVGDERAPWPQQPADPRESAYGASTSRIPSVRGGVSQLELLQILAERSTQVVPMQRELHRGFQETQLVAGIVARAFKR